MKRKALVKVHVIATIIAAITIATFFVSSLIAELNGSETLIREVKEVILFSLPLLLIAMPALGVTGSKLAGKLEAPVKLTTVGRGKLTTCFAGEDLYVQVC